MIARIEIYIWYICAGPAIRNIKPLAEQGKKVTKPAEFTKKANATLKQKIEILDWYHQQNKGFSQKKTAEYWDKTYPNLCLKQPTISAWLTNEEKYRQQYADSLARGHTGNAKRAKQTEHPEINEMLELWIAKAMSDNIQLSGEIIRQKWNRFADLMGVPSDSRLHLSDGWLDSLKKRCGLKNFKRHGEAGSAKPNDIQHERKRVSELIQTYNYPLKDVFNMDETGLFWA
jgi:Tc5 transposase DNA-binding domain